MSLMTLLTPRRVLKPREIATMSVAPDPSPEVARLEAEILRLRQDHDRRVTELLQTTGRLVEARRALSSCLREAQGHIDDPDLSLKITTVLASTQPR